MTEYSKEFCMWYSVTYTVPLCMCKLKVSLFFLTHHNQHCYLKFYTFLILICQNLNYHYAFIETLIQDILVSIYKLNA